MSEKAPEKEKGLLKTYSKFNKFTGTVALGAGVGLLFVAPEIAPIAFGVAAFDFGQSAVVEGFRKWRAKSKQSNPQLQTV